MLWFALLLACVAPPDSPVAPPPSASPAAPVPLPVWPAPGAELRPLPPPPPGPSLKVFLVAGHGAPGNSGNRGALCQVEQDVVRDLTAELGEHLLTEARFAVKQARVGAAQPTYAERTAAAKAWGADLQLELHTDARGDALATVAYTADGGPCWRDDADPGFSVLWSDEGPAELVAKRRSAAIALARRLLQVGFPATAAGYAPDAYAPDPAQLGVFVDRHPAKRRLYMLRRPSVPSIIVETHNAVVRDEALAWQATSTRLAFYTAVSAALADIADAPQ